jgi:4'-phosphopantetheinyl transferase
MSYMPLELEDKRIKIGLWKIEEDEKYFRDRLNIYENEEKILSNISHPRKKLEWLSSRLCLKTILDITHRVESLNETTGRPFLSDSSYHISYSHSNNYAGAIASDEHIVAMDLEDLTKKRNLKSRFLFMQPEELEYFDSAGDLRAFFLIWSAKETLYKIYAKKGIAFKEHLLIDFQGEPVKEKGSVMGYITLNGRKNEYEILYQFFSDILLTYTYCPNGLCPHGVRE